MMDQFQGFPRADGRVGTRNAVVVIPVDAGLARICQIVQAALPDVVSIGVFDHPGSTESAAFSQRVLSRFASSANVYGVILVATRKNDQLDVMGDFLSKTHVRLVVLDLVSSGGPRALADAVIKASRRLLDMASKSMRRKVPVSEIVLGTECGGSDAFSGVTANPALGVCSDRIVAAGGTAILAEIPELIGAEHLLAKRAVNSSVSQSLLALVSRWERFALEFSEDIANANPSAGNIKGGITTLAEKSLGCIHKGGSSPVVDVVGFGEASLRRGLVVMDTDGDDIAQLTALSAGDANVIVFTTGAGTPVASPVVPTIKVSSTTEMAARLEDLVDFDAGRALSGESIESLGRGLYDLVVATASGRLTKAEHRNQRDFALPPTGASA